MMKYFYACIITLSIGVFCFCSGEKETVKDNTKNPSIAQCLDEKTMFLFDSVTKVSEKVSAQQKAEGRKYFLQAMDILVNKKNPQGSIEFFKESIFYYPSDKSYFYLTKAYIATGDAENARKASEITGALGYEPFYEVYYQDALISALGKDTNLCLENLSQAIMEGFLNKDRLNNEKAFDFMRDNERFQAMMVNTFNDDAKLKQLVFKGFLKLFPDMQLPYTEPIDSVSRYNYDHYINYDYAAFIPGMEDGRFSRDVTNEYLYVGKLRLDNNHQAVIYKTVLAIADTLNPVKTYVQTYDSLGNLLDSEMIGCFCSPTSSMVFTIDKDYTIHTTEYKVNWLNDPLEKGYAGNTITSTEAGKSTSVRVDVSGTIAREGVASSAENAKTKSGG
ncbi:MAG: hypothetical protein JST26_08900 [Bacteroidetes bacterium]|nr:hypothetical protein [Bacteroidota bacterium]